jgi:peroxiredoxin
MSKVLTPGELAPDFELKDVEGNRRRLSDFRGKPVVLAFLRGFL